MGSKYTRKAKNVPCWVFLKLGNLILGEKLNVTRKVIAVNSMNILEKNEGFKQ